MGIIDILGGLMHPKMKMRNLETINPKDPSLPGYIDQVRQVVNKTNRGHLYFAMLLSLAYQYEEAEQEYLKAVENKEQLAKKQYAAFLFGRHRAAEAEPYCQELLDEKSELAQTTLIMAMIKMRLKKSEESEYYFQESMRLGNNSAKAWYFDLVSQEDPINEKKW